MHIVDDYRPDSGFFFGTNSRSLLTSGHAVVLPGRGDAAPARAETVLRALGQDEILVGAVPFDDNTEAHLVIPETHHWGPPLAPAETVITSQLSAPVSQPSAQQYHDATSQALRDIDNTALRKVVLARSLRMRLSAPLDTPAVLRRLRHHHGPGFVFACAMPEGTLLGGSPELLVSRQGDTVTAYPLAGSRPRANPASDRYHRADLLSSPKDLAEHAHVVDHISESLAPLCTHVDVPRSPHIVTTDRMLHLGTKITASLATGGPSALSLAAALHPTPAVCGTPTTLARETIGRLEGFDRRFYSGMVGWCDAHGNGEWAVTIRCAQARDDEVRLYAGAGIVAGSDPESEVAETRAKWRTMLRALGHQEEVADGRDIHAMA